MIPKFSQTPEAPHNLDLELNFYLESPRSQVPLRLRDAMIMAVDQFLIEQGNEISRNRLVELSLIERLGGVSEIVKLINRYVERVNRKARAADPEAGEWYIDRKKLVLAQHKADY